MRLKIARSLMVFTMASLVHAGAVFAQPTSAGASAGKPEYGPARGTLVIIGGGADGGTGIRELFINRAGGLGAKLVVVPTAGGNKNANGTIKEYNAETVLRPWKAMGLENVTMLHTHDPKV